MAGSGMKEKVSAAVKVIAAIAEAIRELGEVPSGHVYAVVQNVVSLDQYEKCIQILVNAKLVRKDPSHLLHWIGPAI
jgi:hypothetical protein